MTNLRAGDLIGIADNSWLSRQIRRATGNGPVSHIQIVTATEPFVQVAEALSPIVTVNPLAIRLKQASVAYVMSPALVTDAQRLDAATLALSKIGTHYNYADILLQELDSLTDSKFWTEHFADPRIGDICSMLAALDWPCLHLDVKSVTPNDLFFQAQNHPKDWLLGQLK